MKVKTRLRIIQILLIISLLLTLFSIQRTYAKYYETIDTNYATDIKKWIIKINNTNIHNHEELDTIMTPVLEEDVNANDNVLVPGRKGYFPFEIDYEYVDLSFQLGFNVEQLNTNKLEDFEIYGYSIIKGEKSVTVDTTDISSIKPIMNIDLDQDTKKYKYSIEDANIEESDLTELETAFNKNGANKKIEIRILFRWNDENADTTDANEVSGMNNYEDTQFRGNIIDGDDIHTNLNYKVRVSFTQKI